MTISTIQNYRNLVRIARQLSEHDPILGHDLENSVVEFAKVAVVNPGVQTFGEHLKAVVDKLRDAQKELETAIEDNETADQFKAFFDEQEADFVELEDILEDIEPVAKIGSHTAGIGEWLKKLFKKTIEEPSGASPSYSISEDQMDEFVEGTRDWADAEHYIESEAEENKQFFDGAAALLDELSKVKKNPSKESVIAIKDSIEKLIEKGDKLIRGIRRHMVEPSDIVEGLDEDPEIEISEEEPEGVAIQLEGGKFGLKDIVDHYVSQLQEAGDDEDKLANIVKDLVEKIQEATTAAPLGKAASTLIKIAYQFPKTRNQLLPVIHKLVK